MLGKFSKLSSANGYSAKTKKPSAVILGDDGTFWVVTLGRMESLLLAGYELAN